MPAANDFRSNQTQPRKQMNTTHMTTTGKATLTPNRLACWALLFAALLGHPATSLAQSTAFTYQGQLIQGATAANGSYDMKFNVWDASSAGNFIAGPVTNLAVGVSNGLFTVSLDFGASVFTGNSYWVELGVRTNGNGAFATLSPRQQLTPAAAAFSLSTQSPQYNSLCPAGSVVSFAGSAAPAGWLLCNGSAVSRTTYAALFAVVVTTYGAGDGSTTFNLPDLRSRSVIGAGQGAGLSNRTLGQTLGEETHTLTTSEIPPHTHTITDPGHSHTYTRVNNPSSGFGDNASNQSFSTANTSTSTTGISINNSGGGGQAHNNMQPSLVLNSIIKY
jgi:microcystin-dependent protein